MQAPPLSTGASPPEHWPVWGPLHLHWRFPSCQARWFPPGVGGAFPMSLVPPCSEAIADGPSEACYCRASRPGWNRSSEIVDSAPAMWRCTVVRACLRRESRARSPAQASLALCLVAACLPLRRSGFFPALHQSSCSGFGTGRPFPDGTEALTLISPCRTIAKRGILGPATGPVLPVLGQISHGCGPYHTRFVP